MENKKLDFLYTHAGLIYQTNSLPKYILSKVYLFIRGLINFFKKNQFISKHAFLTRYDIILQTVLIRTSCIKGINFPTDINLYGDLDFFLKLVWINNVKIYFNNKRTTLYRIHDNQLTRKSSNVWLIESQKLYDTSYNKILEPEELELFKLSQVQLHQGHYNIEQGDVKKGLELIQKTSTLSLGHKIHYWKLFVKNLFKSMRREAS